MGLDISAYDDLQFEKIDIDEESDIDYELIYIYNNTDFPETSSGFKNGYYKHNGKNETRFRAGSYSGYNRWRSQLCEMVNNVSTDDVFEEYQNFTDLNKELKMMELIFFSDCEGYIGTKASQKLFQEFQDNQTLAIEYSQKNDDKNFLNTYTEFLLAFKIASNDGVVSFH